MFSLFKVTHAAVHAVSKLVTLQLRGFGDEGDDDTAEPTDDAPLLGMVGFAVLPIARATLRVLGLRYGEEIFPVAMWDKARTPAAAVLSGGEEPGSSPPAPPALTAGETRVYSAQVPGVCARFLGGLIELRVNRVGLLHLAPDTPGYAGQRVARVGDHIEPHTHGPGTFTVGSDPVTGVSGEARPKIQEGAPNVWA